MSMTSYLSKYRTRSRIISTLIYHVGRELLFCSVQPYLIRVVLARGIVRTAVLLVAMTDEVQVLHHTANVGILVNQIMIFQSRIQRVSVLVSINRKL